MDPLTFPALVALAALAAASQGGDPTPVSLECLLEAAKVQTAGGPVLVRFRLRNHGRQAVAVLDWHTPLEGLLANIFTVRPAAGGDALRYKGPLVKRGDPEADEYVEIPPGGEASQEVDLAAAYDLSRPGRFRVSFKGPLRDVTSPSSTPRPRDRHVALTLACPPIEIEIVTRAGS